MNVPDEEAQWVGTGGENPRDLYLPLEDKEVLPNIRWGRIEAAMTPAFWATLCWFAESSGAFDPRPLADTIEHEVAACLLGGYGMPAEVGWAAYERLLWAGLLDVVPSRDAVVSVLSKPLMVNGRPVKYRFVAQKADYLSRTLESMAAKPIVEYSSGTALRGRLVECPGVGPKTASWVARNWLGADDVAILDVHVVRACVRIGVMPSEADPSRDYAALEKNFLGFAKALAVRPSILDGVMWRTMKDLGSARI